MDPKVSVIILNYNGKAFVLDCLMSLERQTFGDFEVIVVDNGSSDGSVEVIRKHLGDSPSASRLTLVATGKNLGFTGGNIEGLKHARGEYVLLLNNDTEADVSFFGELVRAMDAHPGVGMCASRMLLHGTDLIDSAGDGFSRYLKGYKRGEGERAERFDKEEYVFAACGGATLLRRKMIEEIGFLDDDFFINFEDVDLGFRAQLAGWKVRFVPAAVVRHKVSSSIGKLSDTQAYYSIRNSEFVRVKNVPLSVFIRCLPAYLAGVASEFYYFVLRHGRFRVYLRAKLDALRLMPGMLRKRRKIMSTKKVPSRYILQMMTPALDRDFLRRKGRKFFRG
jgi:GT2 family glycosyltransferase